MRHHGSLKGRQQVLLEDLELARLAEEPGLVRAHQVEENLTLGLVAGFREETVVVEERVDPERTNARAQPPHQQRLLVLGQENAGAALDEALVELEHRLRHLEALVAAMDDRSLRRAAAAGAAVLAQGTARGRLDWRLTTGS